MDHAALQSQISRCIEYVGRGYCWGGASISMTAAPLSEANRELDIDLDSGHVFELTASPASFCGALPGRGDTITGPDGAHLLVQARMPDPEGLHIVFVVSRRQ